MKKINYCLLAIFCPCLLYAQVMVKGMVINDLGQPVAGANIKSGNTALQVIADAKGAFYIGPLVTGDSLSVSAVGHQPATIFFEGSNSIQVTLTRILTTLGEVVINTGYQTLSTIKSTGAADVIDNKLINRSAETNILDRIQNLSPGLLFNKGDALSTDAMLIRGRSTIFANAQPLIVLDNFPYDGDLSSINPFDVESITILKDAAAASIWGARAGNGVIVITTKKGTTAKPKIQFTTAWGARGKPDFSALQFINSADRIEVDKLLFEKGFYNNANNDPSHTALSPVIELLIDKKAGTITPAEADQQIAVLQQNDVISDIKKYLYQPANYRQHALNISGNTAFHNYYFSVGWDDNKGVLKAQKDDRITIRTGNNFNITDRLQLQTTIQYGQFIKRTGAEQGINYSGVTGRTWHPYASLADADGTPLPVSLHFRQPWLDTIGAGLLLPWDFKPIQEINEVDNRAETKDRLLAIGFKYEVFKNLEATVNYQFVTSDLHEENLYKSNSFYVRHQVNNFTQINYNTKTATYPIPRGGIKDIRQSQTTSHQGRAQFNYHKQWSRHEILALSGFEMRSINYTTGNHRIYGYDPEKRTLASNLDFSTLYKLLSSTNSRRIDNFQAQSDKKDHFISTFANAVYTYDKRYILSASARKDEANLFGVKTNQKGTPLWSAGIAWLLSNEPFYKVNELPYLKLKASWGFNGNISRQASAYTTIRYNTASTTPATVASVINPPNENLRWEKVGIFNTGVEFETKNNRIKGTVEYYLKKATDLIGRAPVDPTLGFSENYFLGNIASMKGNGWDVQVQTKNINTRLSWSTAFIYSITKNEVTKYFLPVSAAGNSYLFEGNISPIQGRSVWSLLSYQWAGLDPQTGDPIGIVDKNESKNYAAIYNNTSLYDMTYNGPVQPQHFGALRNDFSFQGIGLSFNIIYQFGHYFRTRSVLYAGIVNSFSGHADYSRRWQAPGDEQFTHIPSFVYPANASRDAFYRYSGVLVKKAGNFRLQDIVLDYNFKSALLQKLPLQTLRIFLNITDINLAWLQNDFGIDPHFNNTIKENRKWMAGITASF